MQGNPGLTEGRHHAQPLSNSLSHSVVTDTPPAVRRAAQQP